MEGMMKENVGQSDQMVRAVAGPLLIAAGYAMGGRELGAAGLVTMIAGAVVTGTAVTKKCPLNAFLGVDTRERDEQPWTSRTAPAIRPFEGAREYRPESVPSTEATAEREKPGPAHHGVRKGGIDVGYDNFVNAAASLSFMPDEETAEAAVKAVLGILASRLEEPEAQRLVSTLPEPLSLENLRGHQMNATELTVEQYYGTLATQFGITSDQAQVLAVTVLRLVKEALDVEGMREVERSLPEDWTQLIERV
jgi:uncharacterized protein (DUF2267 family)